MSEGLQDGLLYRVAEALNRTTDAGRALQDTLDLVGDHFGLATGWVWLREPETGRFFKAAERNLPPFLREPVRMTGAPCTCLEEFAAGHLTPRTVEYLYCSRLRSGGPSETGGLVRHASVPLFFGDRPLGVMNLAGERTLSEADLQTLSTVAYLLGTALERSRLAGEEARAERSRERARLAREIHDVLAQDLTAVGLYLEGALGKLDSQPQVARDRLERALSLTRETLEEARRSVEDLRAAALDDRPLAEALAAEARRFTSESGVPVRLRVSSLDLPLRVETEMLRVTREALSNVRRHAGARQVDLRLSSREGRAVLSVADDGRGLAGAAGHGLQGMRERARRLGGRLQVSGAPGRGTRVTLSVPLP